MLVYHEVVSEAKSRGKFSYEPSLEEQVKRGYQGKGATDWEPANENDTNMLTYDIKYIKIIRFYLEPLISSNLMKSRKLLYKRGVLCKIFLKLYSLYTNQSEPKEMYEIGILEKRGKIISLYQEYYYTC